jgi:hypothetical protein
LATEFLGTANLNSDNFMADGLYSIEERLQRYGDFTAMSSTSVIVPSTYQQCGKHVRLV